MVLAADEPGHREEDTEQGGREVVEMKGGREAVPQTSHLPPKVPRGLQGMGTSLVSTQPPLSMLRPAPAWDRLCLAGTQFSHTFP
ncbi:hypothetical protein NQZ68_039437 [Dissostichus eleginoides]|nr:hypothetical protein NQZ68_039437 [Dissostichus eleginoides]